METIEKIDVRKMKEDIKKMVAEQRSYKLQRKYKLPEGMIRTVSQSEAQWKHRSMRDQLRLMYAAYGLARGKSFSQTENKYPEETHPLNFYREIIQDRVDRYKVQVPVEQPQQ